MHDNIAHMTAEREALKTILKYHMTQCNMALPLVNLCLITLIFAYNINLFKIVLRNVIKGLQQYDFQLTETKVPCLVLCHT